MTAKEKAKELVSKYYTFIDFSEVYQVSSKSSKECALICVDDKITSIAKFKHPTNSRAMNRRVDRELSRLQEVKEEINKL
jgi:hypothetical protein